MGISCVAVYVDADADSLFVKQADEAIRLSDSYLNSKEIIAAAKSTGAQAIHPGYGFLSENPEFADECTKHNILFVGPSSKIMRSLGNKVEAKKTASKANVPTIPSTGPLPKEIKKCKALAKKIGYPIMLKASWGGGGRGMRVIRKEEELENQINTARREAKSAFGKDDVFLEKLIEKAFHVEVQIIGDTHGNIVHLYERDCSLQRRHQKVVERAPAAYLSVSERNLICEAGVRIGKQVNYSCAGLSLIHI